MDQDTTRRFKVEVNIAVAQLLWATAYGQDDIACLMADLFILTGCQDWHHSFGPIMTQEKAREIISLTTDARLAVLDQEQDMITRVHASMHPDEDIPF